jgi:Uma2 family endonuclease
MTSEDLYRLPQDGRGYELVEGVLVSEPPPGAEHGRVEARVVVLVATFVRANRLGTVYCGDAGFVLNRSPDTVRGPDLAFVARRSDERAAPTVGYLAGAPDLAVEIRSPSDRVADLHGKIADYLAAGTRLVWVLDPVARNVRVYRSLLEPRALGPEDLLDGEDVLPGFRVRVSELFDE